MRYRTPGTVSQFEPALKIAPPWGNTWITECDNHIPRRAQDSLLDQLHNALGVHEEDLPISLPLQGGRMAVQDGGYLHGKTGQVTGHSNHTIWLPRRSHQKDPPQAPMGIPFKNLKFQPQSPLATQKQLCTPHSTRGLRTQELRMTTIT